MIGQLLGDAAGWAWENPWRVAAGVAAWVVASVTLALVAGPVIGRAEDEELGVVDPW